MENRVVVTGMGVCAPNGIGLMEFTNSLKKGISGIRFHSELEKLNFGCQIAGKPLIKDIHLNKYFTKLQLKGLNASGVVYGVLAGKDAWSDADLPIPENDENPDWNSGIIFGTGILGVDKFREAIYKVDEGNVRRLGSTSVIQTMASGISAYLGGMLGCGNQVTTNSSACTTGTEAILMGYERIKYEKARRMLIGSCSDSGPYVWGGFDAMRILPRDYNNNPEAASRPMSASAAGFVPGSGAGALILESLESAVRRRANIYGEILGGSINSGGQRGGTMTAPNNNCSGTLYTISHTRCRYSFQEIDAINGHLTATSKDTVEIQNWTKALEFPNRNFLLSIHLKVFLVTVLQQQEVLNVWQPCCNFRKRIFGNINCEDVHPEILTMISISKIPQTTIDFFPKIIAKASFGFGDVNACIIFKSFSQD